MVITEWMGVTEGDSAQLLLRIGLVVDRLPEPSG